MLITSDSMLQTPITCIANSTGAGLAIFKGQAGGAVSVAFKALTRPTLIMGHQPDVFVAGNVIATVTLQDDGTINFDLWMNPDENQKQQALSKGSLIYIEGYTSDVDETTLLFPIEFGVVGASRTFWIGYNFQTRSLVRDPADVDYFTLSQIKVWVNAVGGSSAIDTVARLAIEENAIKIAQVDSNVVNLKNRYISR